jgi:hypothetical protein
MTTTAELPPPARGGIRSSRLRLRLELGLMAVLGLVGLVATAAAVGTGWAELPISSIAADPAAAGPFRLTMTAVGIVGLVLAIEVGWLVERARRRGLTTTGWARFVRLAWLVAAVGFIGVGLFPIGVSPVFELAHGTCGYAIPIAVLALMLLVPLAFPTLRGQFGRASLAGIAVILGLYVLAVGGWLPYAAMEVGAFAICGVWAATFLERLVDLAGPA